MPFKYDLFGWFAGGVPTDEPRTVPMAPPSQSTTTTVGELRANWNGVAWVMLPYVAPAEIEPQPEPEDPRLWWMDVGPFYDRFGPDALAIAASDHGACRAVQTLTGVRKYIDLKDPRVAAMIDMLIATQQPAAVPYAPGSGPMTPAKKAAILTRPTTEAERHVKGLKGLED